MFSICFSLNVLIYTEIFLFTLSSLLLYHSLSSFFTPSISFLTFWTNTGIKYLRQISTLLCLLRKQCVKGDVRVYDFYKALSVNINLISSEKVVLLVSGYSVCFFSFMISHYKSPHSLYYY